MPKVVDQFLGRVRGKIGDVIFKITHGFSYATRAPLARPASTDPKAIIRMKRFGLATKLAHAVNAISFLKHIWKESPMIGSGTFQTTTNKIMKKNYKHVLQTGLSDEVALVPGVGFTFTPTSVTIANDEVTVVGAPVGFAGLIDIQVETSFRLAVVLFLMTTANEEYPEYSFIHAVSAAVPVNLTTPITFTIPLTEMDTKYYDAYSVRKAFFTLITTTDEDVPVHYSDTVCNG